MMKLFFSLCLTLVFLTSAFCEDDMQVLLAKAKAGDPAAQASVGTIYALGRPGTYRDTREAAKWFTKAAEQGNADAQFSLAGLYELGRGGPKDMSTAVKWYGLAAKQGIAAPAAEPSSPEPPIQP